MGEIQYLVYGLMSAYIAFMFYRTIDGMLRKIMIAFFVAQAFDFLTYYWAVLCSANTDHWLLDLTSVPQAITLVLLIGYFHKNK